MAHGHSRNYTTLTDATVPGSLSANYTDNPDRHFEAVDRAQVKLEGSHVQRITPYLWTSILRY